jgi:hypothetical protein
MEIGWPGKVVFIHDLRDRTLRGFFISFFQIIQMKNLEVQSEISICNYCECKIWLDKFLQANFCQFR